MKSFDDLMSAITFAEAGEHEAAREVLRGRKSVLLALSDRSFDRKAFRYAIGVSKRVDAALEILFIKKDDRAGKGLADFMKEVEREGFRFSLVMKTGCVKKAILEYLDKRRDIQFAIVGSDHELAVDCEEKSFQNFWKKLKCPLVVVSKTAEPAATQP